MKVIPNYEKKAFIVPGALLGELKDVTKNNLTVLLYVLGCPDFTLPSVAEALGISVSDTVDALTFWQEKGIIELKGRLPRVDVSASNENVPGKVSTPRKKHPSSTLPSYTTAETAKFLEDNAGTAEIIDSCENIIGKIFTTAETAIVIGMMDHLSLSGDYILLLFAHAAKIDRKSVRYVEKLALSFVDSDITRYDELVTRLAEIELADSTMRLVRRLFGLGGRSLTSHEKKMINDWCVTWDFSPEIIEKAYEVTADSTGGASLKYANAVLENWYNAGLKTPEQIDKHTEEFEKTKKGSQKSSRRSDTAVPLKSSFDTDDFFEAALRRSYEEDSENNK